MVYATHQQQHPNSYYGGPGYPPPHGYQPEYPPGYGPPPFDPNGPQYPPKSYSGYDPTTGFAPVSKFFILGVKAGSCVRHISPRGLRLHLPTLLRLALRRKSDFLVTTR